MMRALLVLLALTGCTAIEAREARQACFEAGDCWKLAASLVEEGADGEAKLQALLAPGGMADADAPGAQHSLVVDYALRNPGWASRAPNMAHLVDAIAWPPRRGAAHRLPYALHVPVYVALDARGITVRMPLPDDSRRDEPRSDPAVRHARWCTEIFPILGRRLSAGRLTVTDARALLRYRCPGSDARLAELAQHLATPPGAALHAGVASAIPPQGARKWVIWGGGPLRNSPWQVVKPFLAPELPCAIAEKLVGFAEGPYRLVWRTGALAFGDAVVAWRQRCDSQADWSRFIEQLPGDMGAAVHAAHAPGSMSCAYVRENLEQMRSWVDRSPMPASITALEAAERLRCPAK